MKEVSAEHACAVLTGKALGKVDMVGVTQVRHFACLRALSRTGRADDHRRIIRHLSHVHMTAWLGIMPSSSSRRQIPDTNVLVLGSDNTDFYSSPLNNKHAPQFPLCRGVSHRRRFLRAFPFPPHFYIVQATLGLAHGNPMFSRRCGPL